MKVQLWQSVLDKSVVVLGTSWGTHLELDGNPLET
jgi:hypothetical protein